MARHPRTGMERLLRLRAVQIAQAQFDAGNAESALRGAEQQLSASRQAVAAFSSARQHTLGAAAIDLARYEQLLHGEQNASLLQVQCEATALERRREAEQAATLLQERLLQRKAASARHESLRSSLQHALDLKLDGQLCELWQNSKERSP